LICSVPEKHFFFLRLELKSEREQPKNRMSGGESNMAGNEENLLDDLLRPSFHDEDDHLFGSGGAGGNDNKNDDDSSSSSSDSGEDDNHSDISEESEKGGGDGIGDGGGSAISDDDDEDDYKMSENEKRSDSGVVKRRRVEISSVKDEPQKNNSDKEDDGQKNRSKDDAGKTSTSASSAAGAAGKKKKGKSYDYATKLNYLFRDARFFVVKSNNSENVALAKSRGVWSTPPQNESRLNKAFDEVRNVLLIYSVKESGKFAGFARLSLPSARTNTPIPWILPPGLSARALGGVFKIDWICKKVQAETR